MTGVLMLDSLTRGNTLKQGDKTPLTYKLLDADGDKLDIAGKTATVRLVHPNYLTIGYEKSGLTVASDDTVTFTIDKIVPARKYHVEIIVDNKFVFPSRSAESKFTIDKSSLGTEANIIEIVGKDVLINAVKSKVDTELQPLVTSLQAAQQAETQRVSVEASRVSAEAQRKTDHANRSAELAAKADKVVIKNFIENGNVVSTRSYETPAYINFTQDGELRAPANYSPDQPIIPIKTGHQYYTKVKFRQGAVRQRIYLSYSGNANVDNGGPLTEALEFSGLITGVQDVDANLRFYGSAGIRTKEEVMFIDLTETFGAGNEPTKEEMDELIKVTGYINGEYALNNKEMLGYLINDIRGKADKVVVNNQITNGDFSNGAAGWIGFNSEIQGQDGYVTLTSDGSSNLPYIVQVTDVSNGDIFYGASKVRPLHEVKSIFMLFNSFSQQYIYGPEVNQYHTLSFTHKVTTTNRYIGVRMQTLENVQGVQLDIAEVMLINLTQTFGAGNEPSKEEMDSLIEITGYINGEYALNNKEMLGYLMNGKANKKQEDWLTATLMNGATGDVKYRKNDFGRVEFTGYINFPTEYTSGYVMSIASGYRPKADLYLPAGLDAFGVGSVLYFRTFSNGNSVWANNVWAGRTAYLDGLSYFN